MFRLLLKPIVLLAVTLSVVCVSTEGLIRLLVSESDSRIQGLVMPDSWRTFKLVPGFHGLHTSPEFSVSIHINSTGLRDREIALVKPPGTYRILVLGDSFTFGNGVEAEQSYPKRLEEMLNASLACGKNTAFEVINAGVSGYGTFHEEIFLKQDGIKYNPDFLIVQFYPDNDLTDNLYPFSYEVRQGFLVLKSTGIPDWLLDLKDYFRIHSHAYRFFGNRYQLLKIRFGMQPQFAASMGLYLKSPSPQIRQGWEATAKHLTEIVRVAREQGLGVMVIRNPRKDILDQDLWQSLLRFQREAPESADWDVPTRMTAELCRAQSIPCFDLTPLFRETPHPIDFYYRVDGHWNVRGHQMAAQWIFQRMRNLKDTCRGCGSLGANE